MNVFRPPFLLRCEGAALLAGALALYHERDYAWIPFILIFLLPDLSMIGYVWDPRFGAATYNIAHSVILPVGLALFGLFLGYDTPISVAVIWAAHIGFDRMVGYGLKEPTAFGDTHLGRVGRDRAAVGPAQSG